METIKRTLNTNKVVNLYIFGDEHIGDANCDINYLKKRIEKVANDPNGVWIGNGDIMNTALKNSVSDVYNSWTPMEEMKFAIELFKPIADKCLCFGSGNHENRVAKDTSIDVSWVVASELGVPYFENSAIIFLRFGMTNKQRPIVYSIFVRHGSGGGSAMGGKANKMKKNSEIIDADLFITGHTHSPICYKEDFYRLSYPNSSVDKVTRTFINIGSSLDYGGYGERFGFAPSSKIHPVAHLHPHRKNIDVTL